MRVVRDAAGLAEAYERCAAEALAGFGDGTIYAEALAPDARHIEVQIVADGARAVVIGDRDCSVQRRHQKLVEVAPAELTSEPVTMEEKLRYDEQALRSPMGATVIALSGVTLPLVVDTEWPLPDMM